LPGEEPFPTRLVAEGLDDVSGERVFVAMYGIALPGIRVLLYAFDTYARWEHLFAPGTIDEPDNVRRSILPVVAVYALSILIGLALPALRWRCTAPSPWCSWFRSAPSNVCSRAAPDARALRALRCAPPVVAEGRLVRSPEREYLGPGRTLVGGCGLAG
jgi:hypothetical protein